MSEERERMEQFLDLFLHPAWRMLVADLDEQIEVLDQLDSVSTLEDLYFRRGELARLRQLAGLEERIRHELDQLDEQQADELPGI
jgi:hypothetical protein